MIDIAILLGVIYTSIILSLLLLLNKVRTFKPKQNIDKESIK